jgi:glycosyltransferase involved in cell wall biosynthesis
VIVVDDCSTDGTTAVVEQVNDPRVRLLEQESRRGAPAARNRGLKEARAELVQFLDADDVLAPTKIGRCLDVFRARPELTSVFTGAYFFPDDAGRPVGPEYPPMDAFTVRYLLNRLFATACGLHRRSAVLALGGFREELKRGQEFDLHLRLAVSGAAMTYIPDRLVGIREHTSPNRITNISITSDQMAELICGVVELAMSQNHLAGSEKRLLAERAMTAGMSCYRNGSVQAGRDCMTMASRLYPRVKYPHGSFVVRAMARAIGPAGSEELIRFARKLVR